MRMVETVYNVGDEVTINKILWKVKSIRHRFGGGIGVTRMVRAMEMSGLL